MTGETTIKPIHHPALSFIIRRVSGCKRYETNETRWSSYFGHTYTYLNSDLIQTQTFKSDNQEIKRIGRMIAVIAERGNENQFDFVRSLMDNTRRS